MSHYEHLSIKERESILKLSAEGNSIRQIAKKLKRFASTISRELKRNSNAGNYWPSEAEEAYKKRRCRCRRKRLLDDPERKAFVQRKIVEDQWSPEQIDQRTRVEKSPHHVSYATIYRAINAGCMEIKKLSHRERGIVRELRHKGKARRSKDHQEKRGKIPISHELCERPAEADARSEMGHWEADTVLGKAGGSCLVTIACRSARLLLATKVARKSAECVRDGMIKLLSGLPKEHLRSITPDRGKEFAQHALVTAALDGVPFYFPPPHAPWARGTNENTNGLLREYFPKGVDLDQFDDDLIQSVVNKINLRPRKCLNWKTPFEVFFHQVLHLT